MPTHRRHQALRERTPAKAKLSGVTLIELLVAMLIVSMCVGLMSGAFFQVGRLVTVSTQIRSMVVPHFRRHELMHAAVGALALQPAISAESFRGNEDGFETETTEHPLAAWSGRTPLAVRLVRERGDVSLWRCMLDGTGKAPSFELFRSEQRVALRFVDIQGVSHDKWPIADPKERLPSVIQVIQTESGVVLANWHYGGPIAVDPFRVNSGMGG